MIAPQQFGCYPVFGCAATKCEPNPVKYETGYIPGDVLPAEHLNWFLGNDTAGYNLLCAGVSSIEQELATVLSCAGCTPDPTSCSQVYNAVMYQINACISACTAPKDHASSATTYGVGNAGCYGHLKISDEFSCVLSACSGVAASQCALATAYACLSVSGAQLGDTNGCALGTASAGTCNTAARSDHVHPKPTTVTNSNKVCTVVASGNGNRHVLLGETAYTGTCCGGVYVGNACTITFNPSTGLLTATTFCGALKGNSSGTHVGNVYATAPATNTSCCVVIRARCCNASAVTNKDFKFCVNGYMYGDVCGNVCGTAEYSCSAQEIENDCTNNYICIKCLGGSCLNAWCVHVCAGRYPLLIGKYGVGCICCNGYNQTNCLGNTTLSYVSAGKTIICGWLGYECCSACGGCNQAFTEAKARKAFFACMGNISGGSPATMNGWFIIPIVSQSLPYIT